MRRDIRTLTLLTAMLTLAACTEEDTATVATGQEQPVSFGVQVTTNKTTRMGTPGEIDLDGLRALPEGFGVFAYFTEDKTWSEVAKTQAERSTKSVVKPEFMFNQSVSWSEANSAWTYAPVKMWPVDRSNGTVKKRHVSFFAYAPHVELQEGTPAHPTADEDEEGINYTSIEKGGNEENIVSVRTFNPMDRAAVPYVTYHIGENADTQVDLVYGMGTDGQPLTDQSRTADALTGGDGEYKRVEFKFAHALSAINVYVQRVYEDALDAPDDRTHIYVSQFQLKAEAKNIWEGGRFSLSEGIWYDLKTNPSTITYTLSENGIHPDVAGTLDDAQVADVELEHFDSHPGVDGEIRPLTKRGFATLVIPQYETEPPSSEGEHDMFNETVNPTYRQIQFKPSITYSYVTQDNSLLLNTLEDSEGNKYFRQLNPPQTPVDDIRMVIEKGKRYNLLCRIGVTGVHFEVLSVEDWEFPIYVGPAVEDGSHVTIPMTLDEK